LSSAAPRIDFYVLEHAGADARLRLACRLAEKALQHRHRVHALTTDEAAAQGLDDLLWTFRAESFVPHAFDTDPAAAEVPVTIGWDPGGTAAAADLLINLTPVVPPGFDTYQRVIEIVDASEDCRRDGRERFRFYRENGLEPQTHRVT
jgi:DNA polymerase-3 subunit chi